MSIMSPAVKCRRAVFFTYAPGRVFQKSDGMKVFDVHGHLWSRSIGQKRYMNREAEEKWFKNAFLGVEPILEATSEKLIEALDTAESKLGDAYLMCVFALDLGSLFPMEISIKELNNWVVEQAEQDPRGRIIPFACIDPGRDIALEEARRCIRELGVKGFKLYPPTGFYPNDQKILPFYEEVLKLQQETKRTIPVLIHQGFSFSGSKFAQPIYLEEIAFQFKPDLKIIIAHAGIPWVDVAVSIAALHHNVYLDIALYGDLYGFWPEMHMQFFGRAKRAGILNRVLFGSDWPLSSAWMEPVHGDPPWAVLQGVVRLFDTMQMPKPLREMGYPEITGKEMQGILGLNAEELFG
jgi:predicted TIM-barrel fold metal-dependent hydrolase